MVFEATVRDLRRHGDELIERVEAGEQITITRAGHAVAELRPVQRRPLTSANLLERWSTLPHVDPAALRADIDQIVDRTL